MRLRYVTYSLSKGIKQIRTRAALVLTTVGLLAGSGGLSLAVISAAHADGLATDFESPSYTVGNINGQNGWSALGSAGHGCADYDEGVVANTYGIPSFGGQSFRISNAVTSGCFGDQAFAPALSQPAGEPNALDKNGNPVASPLPHFEAQFNIASTTGAMQDGMAMSVSPDNGAGARMSYLRFVDQTDGIHVYFDDATDPSHAVNADSFNESDVATLNYTSPHTVKFSMDFKAGPDNDVVRIYIDGSLVKVGTSWEDYYLYDTESNPMPMNDNSRVVDTLLFREGGTAVPANAGNGYLIDNLSYMSGQTPVNYPATKEQCTNGGWQSYGAAFKNQGDCVSFVATKGKNQPSGMFAPTSLNASGDVTLAGPTQMLSFTATDNGPSASDTGTVTYTNPGASLHYVAPLTCVNVFGKTAYFAYVIPSGNPYSGTWVVWKVVDGSPDTAGFTTASDQNSANALCEAGAASVTSYTVTSGNITVH